jgi:ATP-dependent exoDNAse (exonuclease V) alpha subunit
MTKWQAACAARVYRVGDKVMHAQQLRQGHRRGIQRLGRVVTAISLEDQELRVLDEEVSHGFAELDKLTHAYAVSIHRAQGAGRRYTALTERLRPRRTAAITAAGPPAATPSDRA